MIVKISQSTLNCKGSDDGYCFQITVTDMQVKFSFGCTWQIISPGLLYKTNKSELYRHIIMDNFNSTLNLYFPTTNIMMPSLKKNDGFANAVTASLTSPQVDSSKLQAIFKMLNDDMTVIPFAEQVQAQFYTKGVNDPGADGYTFVNFICKEVWLDAAAR
jgi:hypothetical protein